VATATIINAQLVRTKCVEGGMSIEMQDGLISDVYRTGTKRPIGEVHDACGQYVSAGFIDIHSHGGGNGDYNDGTYDSFEKALSQHMKHGATAICPTLCAAALEELAEAKNVYEVIEPRGGVSLPTMLGFHLEGPFIAPAMIGALHPNYIKLPTEELVDAHIAALGGHLRIWTIAPELPGALALAPKLREQGILLSAGHTDAYYNDMVAAIEAGFTMATHLYSAMSPFTRMDGRRVPGAIESTMILDGLMAEIIADGHHLPPTLLKLIVRAKGIDNLILVTDAMRAAGMPPGEYVLGSLKDGSLVPVDEDIARTADRKSFAGSIATTDRLVRVMRDQAGVALHDAVRMLTVNPARALGVEARKGTIAVGMDADIVMFDEDIRIQNVWVCGHHTVG